MARKYINTSTESFLAGSLFDFFFNSFCKHRKWCCWTHSFHIYYWHAHIVQQIYIFYINERDTVPLKYLGIHYYHPILMQTCLIPTVHSMDVEISLLIYTVCTVQVGRLTLTSTCIFPLLIVSREWRYQSFSWLLNIVRLTLANVP